MVEITRSSGKSGIRRKRGDTLVGTLEKQYKIDFGVRKDMKLSTYLRKKGYPSLSKALKRIEG